MVSLARVVVDDVEDDLDAGAMQRFTTPLSSFTCSPAVPDEEYSLCARSSRSSCSPSSCGVLARPQRVPHEVVDRQQLDRGHASFCRILDRRGIREPAVGAAPRVSGRFGLPHRESLHVRLVDHRLVPWGRGGVSSSQSKARSTTTDFGSEARCRDRPGRVGVDRRVRNIDSCQPRSHRSLA